MIDHAGILAHSIEGAMLCLRTFTQEGFRTIGPHMHPRVTLDCIAMGHSMEAWDAADYPAIRAILAKSVATLQKAGCGFFVCPDNTAHIALEQPGADLALPGLHIAQIVAEKAARDGRRKVGILGTKYTMDGPVYPAALKARGIAHEIPAAEDREVLNRIIFDELVAGVFTAESRAIYVAVIEKLKARGCDAVALVCTEIPLLIRPEHSPLPTLESTTLLGIAAFEVATVKRPAPTWRGGPV